MISVKSVMEQLINPEMILKNVSDVLRAIDPAFAQEEDTYHSTIEAMQAEIGNTVSPSVSEYIAAREKELCEELIYVTWLGFQQNFACYKDPINSKFLDMDYEDFLRERRMHTLPEVKKALNTENAFWASARSLPEEKRNLADGLLDYTCRIETAGFKLAHYFGFILADSFLSHVIPGYCMDSVTTIRYKLELQNYFGRTINVLE